MIAALLWKEFREQRWKLAFGTVMLSFMAGSLQAAQLTIDREAVLAIGLIGALVLSLYSAMGVFGPEATNRTKQFLAVRPVKAWKVFLCKWSIGWLNFALPMLVGMGLVMIISAKQADPGSYHWIKMIRSIGAGLALGTMYYSFTCCLAPPKSGEGMVGLIGLVIMFLMVIHMLIFIQFTGFGFKQEISWSRQIFIGINPFILVNFINPAITQLSGSLILLEQSLLLFLTLMVGKRHWEAAK